MATNTEEILIRAKNEAHDALQQAAGDLGNFSSAITRVLGQVGPLGVAAGAITLLGAAAVTSGRQLADAVEQLDRLSERTGVSQQNLQVLRQIVKENGGNVEAFAIAFRTLNRSIGENDPLLKKLGITTRDTFQAFMQLSRILLNTTDQGKRTAVMVQLLGGRNDELLADLPNIVKNFDAMRESMRSVGLLMGDEVLSNARDLDKAMDDLARTWDGAMKRMQTAAAPWALNIVEGISNVIEKINALIAARDRWERKANEWDPRAPKGRFGGGASGGRGGGGSWADAADAVAGSADNIDIKTSTEKSPREKRLERIIELFHVGTREAEKLLRVLEGLEGRKEIETIRAALREATPLAEQLALAARGTEGTAAELRGTRPQPAFRVDEALPEIETQMQAMDKMRLQWQDFVEQITSEAQIVNDSITALWQGIEGGFVSVFANLTNETQTWGSAMKTLMRSIVDSMLAELGRLIAAQAFKLLLKVLGITIGAATGGLPAVALGAAGAAGTGGVTDALTPRSLRRAGEGAVNVTINALDAKSGLESLISPFGMLRGSNQRLLEATS